MASAFRLALSLTCYARIVSLRLCAAEHNRDNAVEPVVMCEGADP